MDNNHLESVTSRGNNKSFKEMRDFNNEAQNFPTVSPGHDEASKNSSPQINMMLIEKPTVNITSPTSPKRIDVSPSKHYYPVDSLSSNEPDYSPGVSPGISEGISKRETGGLNLSNRLGRHMSPVSQWQDTNVAVNSPILSGEITKENLDDYMMDYNADQDTLKSYLNGQNQPQQKQSVDHLKLLAEFYNIDQQSKQSTQNIKITHNMNDKGATDVISV